MKSFRYISANTVQEAVALLKDYKGKVKLIAGGTDLLGILKDRILPDYPEVLIDIKTISGLGYIEEDAEGLRIGALVRLADLTKSPLVRKRYKVLAEAAEAAASPQIRNMGTLGGNICQDVRCCYYRYPDQIGGRILCLRKGGQKCFAVQGDNRYHAIFGRDACLAVCPSDTAIALSALDARIKIVSTNGDRVIPFNDFYRTRGNVLESDDIVTEIQVAQVPDRAKQKFTKVRSRKSVDFAIASVASIVIVEDGICKDARVALGAVASRPIRAAKAEQAIKGEAIDIITAGRAAEAAIIDTIPLSKNAYKVEVIKTLVKRAILS